MNCLVLGGAGFIGKHLCASLRMAGHQVVAFDLPCTRTAQQHPLLQGVRWVSGDLSQTATLNQLLADANLVFHLVSATLPNPSNDNPLGDLQDNVAATLRLLDQVVAQTTPPQVIFLSSGGTVYGVPHSIPITEDHSTNPLCAYGIGKLAIEKYLALYHHLHGLDYRILRLANPYGPWQSLTRGQGVIPIFLYQALYRKPLELWGDGSVVRDYLYIEDLCAALLAITEYRGSERIFNIGSGTGYSLMELIETIDQIFGTPTRVTRLPGRPCDVPCNILNIQRAEQELDWTPRISLAEGLGRLLPWLRTL